MEAKRMLRELSLRPEIRLKPDVVYELALQITGNEDAAQAAATEYAASVLKQDMANENG